MLNNRFVWVLTLLLPLLGFGCAKRASSASMGPGSAGGDFGGGYYESDDYDDYDYGGQDKEEAALAEDYSRGGGALSSRGRSKSASMIESRNEFKAGEREYEDAPAEPAPTPVLEPVTVDGTVVDTPGQPETQTEPVSQAASKRQMIYTATMQVSVYDVAHAIVVAEALPDRLGGWLHQRSDNQLILRIPAEKLEQAMAEIAELGVVDYRLLEALDVTAQYTDLDSRIKVLEEMQTQLQALLARTKSVEEALEIRKALDQVTLELELARTQIRELGKSIAFSTLVLRFVERGPTVAVPTSNDPFTWVDELGVEITEYR